MKSNVNKNQNRLMLKLLLLSGVFVVAATAIGARLYSTSIQEAEHCQQDEAMLDRLVQARKFDLLIQELNSGHTAEARRFLNIMFASDIQQANKLVATAGPTTAAEAKFTLADFARAEKAHPEYYAVEQNAKTPVGSVQLARHVAGQ
jgi:hypothetical protein